MNSLFSRSELPPPADRPDLPELQGSPRQREWAVEIRSRVLRRLYRGLDERRELLRRQEGRGLADQVELSRAEVRRYARVIERLERSTSAKWLIDEFVRHRDEEHPHEEMVLALLRGTR